MSYHMHHWNPDLYARHIEPRLPIIKETVNLLQLLPGQRVLDVGCGEGTVTQMLLEKGLQVIGIDVDTQQVLRARKKGIDARVMSAMNIDWQNEFDAIFSNWCFHWLDDHPALFRRLHQALKPGGQLVAEHCATAFNVHDELFEYMNTALQHRGMNLEDVLQFNYAQPEVLRRNLTDAGFYREVYMLVEHKLPLPYGFRDLIKSIFSPVAVAVGDEGWSDFITELETLAAPRYQAKDGLWTLDNIRHRYRVIKI